MFFDKEVLDMEKRYTILHGQIVEKPTARPAPTLTLVRSELEAQGCKAESAPNLTVRMISTDHMGEMFWNGQNRLDFGELAPEDYPRLRELVTEQRRQNRATFSLEAEDKDGTWLLMTMRSAGDRTDSADYEQQWDTWVLDPDRTHINVTYSQVLALWKMLDQLNLLYFRI